MALGAVEARLHKHTYPIWKVFLGGSSIYGLVVISKWQ